MITPRQHQLKAVEKYAGRSVLLAHEMGTGKTITAILKHKDTGAIIVCPSKLKDNWLAELEKMYEDDVQVIEKGKDVVLNKKWTICSYALLPKITAQKTLTTKHAIMDESHFIKGSSIRAKACLLLAQEMETVTLLTGTPVMNKPIELWNQLKCINAKITTLMTRSQFSQRYCGGHLRQMGFRRFYWEGGANHLDELHAYILHDVDFVKKSEVLDIPEKVVTTKVVTMSDEERKEYHSAWNEYLAYVTVNPDYSSKDVENITDARQLVEIGKLKQITSKIKVEFFLEFILPEIGDEQCIVFVEYINSIDLLNAGLKKAGRTYSTIKGESSVQRFQRGEVQFFTSNIISGGQGLNLQNASTLFIIDRNWTPAQNIQAEDRIHRMGQERKSTIYYLKVKDTIDEKIERANYIKMGIINKVVGE